MTGLREKKKRERQERIFSAAIELTNEQGFGAARMAEIAARADLAVGTLYNYYPSKNDLFVAILERTWEEIMQQHRRRIVRMTAEGTDPGEILRRIVSPLVEELFILPKQSWYELLMAMFSSRQYIERGYQMDMEAVADLSAVMRKLQKRGILRKDIEVGQAAYSIYSVLAFQFLAYLFYPGMDRQELHDSIAEQLKIVIEGLGTDAATEPPYSKEEKQ